ncbi:MAG: undecaprenyl-diphosphate phosphatase [Candidatus Heimdallarchaeota archaeon]|nr:undecaprenyl-diphosphate phosphatase [Candidatus Heimdallarchaeota archaeon]
MFNWFILIFALLQGLLEWLPVSSQGQTVSLIVALFQDKADLAFQIALWLHLGTMMAVIVKYRKELFLYLNFKNKDPEVVQWRRFLIFSTVGTIITGVPCFLLVKYLIEDNSVFGEYVMLLIGVALIVTAALLFYSERKKTKSESQKEKEETIISEQQAKERKSVADLSLLQMTASGLFQGFSIIPGISRSGITMSGLLFMGTRKEDAIKGSFLMSIPAVLGGFVLDVTFTAVDGGSIFPIDWWQILIAILITAIIGYLTMELFLFIARKYNFSLICLILGILTIVLFAVRFAA